MCLCDINLTIHIVFLRNPEISLGNLVQKKNLEFGKESGFLCVAHARSEDYSFNNGAYLLLILLFSWNCLSQFCFIFSNFSVLNLWSLSLVLPYRDTIGRVLYYIKMTVMMSWGSHKCLKLVCQPIVEVFTNFVTEVLNKISIFTWNEKNSYFI